MFILRKDGDAYTLHILQPPFLEPAAVEWATKHFQFQYKLTGAPESIAATNADGFDLTIAAPLLQWIYTDKTIVEKDSRGKLPHTGYGDVAGGARRSGANESVRPRRSFLGKPGAENQIRSYLQNIAGRCTHRSEDTAVQ